jgi:hypothetical protein
VEGYTKVVAVQRPQPKLANTGLLEASYGATFHETHGGEDVDKTVLRAAFFDERLEPFH